jgi:phospholipase C
VSNPLLRHLACTLASGVALAAPLTYSIGDVGHVVIFVQENRSFDHYFGTLGGVVGWNDPGTAVLPDGHPSWDQPSASGRVLPYVTTNLCISDVAHDWATGHSAWDAGKWDNWVAAKGVGSLTIQNRATLPYYYALADAYTVCDAYHCPFIGPTNPNRLYLMSGTIDPDGNAGGPVTYNREPVPGFRWKTYPERLQDAGVSWRVYQEADNFDDNALAWFEVFQNAAPGTPLYDRGMAVVPDLATAFAADVAAGTLPKVSWLIASTAKSEHPSKSPAPGEALTSTLLAALWSNPNVAHDTVFILTYDENGGFFDHVPAPFPPAGTPQEYLAGLPIGLGPRVPTVIISPWTRGGRVCSALLDHTSILRFLETWTGIVETNISAWRRTVCGDLTAAFDFTRPDFTVPTLPAVDDADCPGVVSPKPPAVQIPPAQESAIRELLPLPNRPDAFLRRDPTIGAVTITLTNTGTAAAHFAVNAIGNPPAPFDIAPQSAQTTALSVAAGAAYDIQCTGPAGFSRRYVGLNTTDAPFEASTTLDPANGGVALTLKNPTAASVTLTVTNSLAPEFHWLANLAPGGQTNLPVAAALISGKYDLTVTAPAAPDFISRFSGRIVAAPPALTATWNGPLVDIVFPAWAEAFTLESAPSPASGPWTTVTNATTVSGPDRFTHFLPGQGTLWFRLRR